MLSCLLNGVVLRLANFGGAQFAGARLKRADLEGMKLPGANFLQADLQGAYLTVTYMPDACFRGANLANTGLAEIDWERADLRDADLHGSTFTWALRAVDWWAVPSLAKAAAPAFIPTSSTNRISKRLKRFAKPTCAGPISAVHESKGSISIWLTCAMRVTHPIRRRSCERPAPSWKRASDSAATWPARPAGSRRGLS